MKILRKRVKPMATMLTDEHADKPSAWQEFCLVIFCALCLAPVLYSCFVVFGGE